MTPTTSTKSSTSSTKQEEMILELSSIFIFSLQKIASRTHSLGGLPLYTDDDLSLLENRISDLLRGLLITKGEE